MDRVVPSWLLTRVANWRAGLLGALVIVAAPTTRPQRTAAAAPLTAVATTVVSTTPPPTTVAPAVVPATTAALTTAAPTTTPPTTASPTPPAPVEYLTDAVSGGVGDVVVARQGNSITLYGCTLGGQHGEIADRGGTGSNGTTSVSPIGRPPTESDDS